MAEEQANAPAPGEGDDGAAVAESATASPQRVAPRQLPPYKVLLHNDDINSMAHVVLAIVKLTPMSLADAEDRMFEAHHQGVSLLLVTHKERAELYEEQFRSLNLVVTIEPDV